MGKRLRRWMVASAASALMAAAAPAWALSLGMADTFQSGVDGGWSMGLSSVIPAAVVGSGGPAGAGDGYLSLVAIGGANANSRMTVIAGPQWNGNYTATGVDHITMDVNNFSSVDLDLRLALDVLNGPPGVRALSSSAVHVPAGSGWVAVSFSLEPGALTGQAAAALADMRELRLYHSSTAVFPGEQLVASLGVDNVTAVPEPAAAWLLLAGLAALSARRAPQRQRAV
jgi:PEP-CTERM motif